MANIYDERKELIKYKAYDGSEPYLFLSYAHDDGKDLETIFQLLNQNYFRFWFDEGIKTGKEWSDFIDSKIKKCTQFVVFISKNSIDSENVKDEIYTALDYGIEIIRVHLDETELAGGLKLRLGRKQALYRHKYISAIFENKLCSALNVKTAFSVSDISANARKSLLEKYELLESIAKGGTSKVYIGKNKKTGTTVIIKSASISDSQIGSNLKEYFETEKRVLSKRLSYFTPELVDYYYDETSVYLVESYIQGYSLNRMKDLSIPELLEIIIKIAKVLQRYHKDGIIHCDVKPNHIICNDDGCFLIDFGASKIFGDEFQKHIMGTPGYAAPEQFVGYNGEKDIYGEHTRATDDIVDVDRRTDIFAIGRTIKRMIQMIKNADYKLNDNILQTAALFNLERDRFAEGLPSQITHPLEFSTAPNSQLLIKDDPLLRAIVDKMTAEQKSDRFDSMDEVIEVLGKYLKLCDK